MNKKRIITTILVIMLVLISFLGGNSFGKYISSLSKTATYQIAKWSVTDSFLVNGVSSTSETINLAKTYDNTTLANGKIAPGTSGKFTIQIDATGTETGLSYEILFNNISSSIPENMRYTYNRTSYSSLTQLANDLSSGTIAANASNKIITMDILWSWPYETFDSKNSSTAGDIKDTTVGETISSVSFDINIICKQVSPSLST